MRGLISRGAVTAGLRGNDHLLLFNSSHLANWERLRAPELKFPPAGSALDNQWLCLRRGRTEGKDGRGRAPRPNRWIRINSTSRKRRLETPLESKVSVAGGDKRRIFLRSFWLSGTL